MQSDRTRVLLILVAALALLRFGVVPWVRSQNDAHDQLDVLTNRLDRSLGVVNNKQPLQAALVRVRADVEALRGRYPSVPNAAQFRLDVQRKLGELAAARTVQLRSFDWQLDGTDADAGLAYGRVRVTIEGQLKDIIRMHGALEGELPYVVIRDLNLNVTKPATVQLDVPATATVVLDVYYRTTGT